MGYKLKTHSGASKRFKKTGSSVKVKALIEIIFSQSNLPKEKDITEDLISYQEPCLRWPLH